MKMGLVIANIFGFTWGIIVAVIFQQFGQPIFTCWQYWVLLIYPIVVFMCAGYRMK